MAYVFNYPISSLGLDLGRGYAISMPVDWYQQILDNGPLPVIGFLHGGNGSAVDFLTTTMLINSWWEGFGVTANAAKAIAFAPQGVGIDGQAGGDWNAGNLGRSNRLIGVDDVAFFFGALDQLEQYLLSGYVNDVQPVTGGGEITQIYDRSRLMLVGFSNGGQMVYRLVVEAASRGWTVTAVCVFSTSIGGWHREVDRGVALPPNADWVPAIIPSLLHIHGASDPNIKPSNDGVSSSIVTSVEAQVGQFAAPNFERADISAVNSVAEYVAVGTNLVATAGWAVVAATTPPTFPAGVTPNPLNTNEWDSTGGATSDVQTCVAIIPNLAHAVMTGGPKMAFTFFRTWGGL